jgi:predicted GH43/DUF377 family glycosyl hydrolase
MSVKLLHDRVLLRPEDIEPLCPDYDVVGVFNPAATRYGDEIILMVRVAEQPRSTNSDYRLSPRMEWENGRINWVTDTFGPDNIVDKDPRVFWLPDGRVRLRYISHLRLVRLSADGLNIKQVYSSPDLMPCEPWEEFGLEDPRITLIDGTYYITYVAISRQMGVATALMTTRNFRSFERHGIIFPTENKNVVLLPELWNGHFVAYHRPVSHQWIDSPSIISSISPNAEFWGKHQLLISPRPGSWDSVKIGAGPPPICLPQGWLLIYHGVSPATPKSPVGQYCVGAVLLDRKNPLHVLARSEKPLLCPERPSEQQGYVPNVIFPTGALLSKDQNTLLLFVGAADEVTSLIQISIQSILHHLRNS